MANDALALSGVDAFYGSKGYREMIGGGLFKAHPWTQLVRLDVEDPANAAVSHLGAGLEIGRAHV